MNTRLRQLAAFLEREHGPTAVEYAVMLSLVVVVCLLAVTALGGMAGSTFTSVSSALSGS